MSNEELLDFFRALADANRLKIIGLLSQQELSVEQMAEMLHLRPSTISNHLSTLAHVGLVSARAESYYNIYSLNTQRLNHLAGKMLTAETLPSMASDVDVEAYDRKVVIDFSQPDGRLKTIPAQRKKLEAILRTIIRSFEPGIRYSEKQVNEILTRFHTDTSTLRRELIGYGMLGRDKSGAEYWRIESQD